MMGKIGGNQMTNAWKILDRVLPEKKKCHGCELAMTTNDLKDGEFLSCCPDGKIVEHSYNQALCDTRQRLLDTYGKEWVGVPSYEEIMDWFNKYPNYEDDIPEELWDIFKKAVKEGDRDILTKTMQFSVKNTRRECAESILKGLRGK